MVEQYIFSENDKFVVKNMIDGECVTFGSFDNLEDAIELRDELEDYGWPYSKPSTNSINKIEPNIFEEDGIYIVSKKISDFEIVFGKFNSLSTAQSFKLKLIENAWNLNFPNKPFKHGRYIRKDRNFIVNRTIDDKHKTYGSFEFLEEAIHRRDELIDNNWGMDDKYLLCNIGISELDGLNHNIGKAGRKYIVFKWEGAKCIFLAMLPNLSLAIKFRDKLDLNKESSSFQIGDYYFDTKYITKIGDYFRISRVIDGNTKSFGHYKTLEEAIDIRNKLIDNDWDESIVEFKKIKRNKNERNRYIHRHNAGFTIFKRIDGELINFGFFETLDEAREYRDFLEENNWVVEEEESIEEKFDEYIYIKNDGKYYVKNEINGEMRIFGVFDDPLDAIAARLDCIKSSWTLPYVSENEEKNDLNELDPIDSSEIQVIDEFTTGISFEEFISNSLNFPVTVGKSYKNKGWAVKRSYLVDLVPNLPYEKVCKIYLNGIEVTGKINIHTRLFYFKNETLVDYLKKLYDIDPMTQSRVYFKLNHGIYEKSPNISGKNLTFTTRFSKSFKEGLFAIPRSVTKNILPILKYEEQCDFLINNIEIKGKFNLEFRFKFNNKEVISQLEDQIDDGEDVEVILIL